MVCMITKTSEDAHYFKFISTDQEILVGIDTHHHHLLKDNWGTDVFPLDTLAIGTGIINDNVITGIGFDYGTPEDRTLAIAQLRDWAVQNGYEVAHEVQNIYKSGAIYDHDNFSPVAFVWTNGKLHLGRSHPDIMGALMPDVSDYDFAMWHEPGIFGYVYSNADKSEVEIYSDFYKEDYSESDLEACLAALRKRWPNISQVTHGPDEETVEDLDQYFDPREAALEHIARYTK
jgi:hypothetical protein